jgi:hypothetical protein
MSTDNVKTKVLILDASLLEGGGQGNNIYYKINIGDLI